MGGAESRAVISEACSRGYTSREFQTAVTHIGEARRHEFYKIQSLQMLGEHYHQVSVPVWIAGDLVRQYYSCYSNNDVPLKRVAPAWIEHLQQAINDINYAAPGLRLYVTRNQSEARVKIYGTNQYYAATRGNTFKNDVVEMYLGDDWPDMKRTSCHELLHAIGFGHEHQRRDRDSHLNVEVPEGAWGPQYEKHDDLLGITRFDPFSIMLYPEDESMSRSSGDPVWRTKPSNERNREMSELDKVSLNNLYRPCQGTHYSPTKAGAITGLWYCGRYFGVQYPGHDGRCGPNNGSNCPACRVLKSERVEKLWRNGKWQGWTGAVYCGRYFGVQSRGHDGNCGPNNGDACPECYNELLRHS